MDKTILVGQLSKIRQDASKPTLKSLRCVNKLCECTNNESGLTSLSAANRAAHVCTCKRLTSDDMYNEADVNTECAHAQE